MLDIPVGDFIRDSINKQMDGYYDRVQAAVLRAIGHGNSLAVWPPETSIKDGNVTTMFRSIEVSPDEVALLDQGFALTGLAGATIYHNPIEEAHQK